MTFEKMKNALINYPEMTKRVYRIKDEINNIEEAIKYIRYARSVNYSEVPGKSGIQDETYQKAEKIIDSYEKRLNHLLDKIERIYNTQTEITDLLERLSAEERNVIKARYQDGLSWDKITFKVHMSRSACFKCHDRAVKKLVEMAEAEEHEEFEIRLF